MNSETRVDILEKSNIINLVAQNKNKNIIRQEIAKQSSHKLSYSIINGYIKKNLKKTWENKKWVNIKEDTNSTISSDNSVPKLKEPPKKIELILNELDKKFLVASNNLDTITKEEIINHLQTLLKVNCKTLSRIKSLETILRNIEKKKQKE